MKVIQKQPATGNGLDLFPNSGVVLGLRRLRA